MLLSKRVEAPRTDCDRDKRGYESGASYVPHKRKTVDTENTVSSMLGDYCAVRQPVVRDQAMPFLQCDKHFTSGEV
jgi:hypothetical protein